MDADGRRPSFRVYQRASVVQFLRLRLDALCLGDLALNFPTRPENIRLTSWRLKAKLTQVKMAMPTGAGGTDSEAESGMLKAAAWEQSLVCHIVSLSEPSALAFGKETKCPSGIRGNSRFNIQNSSSFSALIQAAKPCLIEANKG